MPSPESIDPRTGGDRARPEVEDLRGRGMPVEFPEKKIADYLGVPWTDCRTCLVPAPVKYRVTFPDGGERQLCGNCMESYDLIAMDYVPVGLRAEVAATRVLKNDLKRRLSRMLVLEYDAELDHQEE